MVRNPFSRTPPPPSVPPPPSGTAPAGLKRGQKYCPKCGAIINRNDPVCPYCNFVFTPGPPPGVLPAKPGKGQKNCSSCGAIININDTVCSSCGSILTPTPTTPPPPLGYVKPVPLAQAAGKSVKGKLYEFFIFEIAGILSLIVPPFFGFPQLTWLALALMAFIPLYMSMPSEHHYLDSLGSGGQAKLDLPLGSLMAKSIFKIIAFSLIILQFYQFFAVFRIICVAIAFLFYFSMPTRYRTSQPYKMIEAWFRMGLGIFIAIILSMTFGGFGPGQLGAAFAFVGLAFFFTFPVHIEDEEEGVIRISSLKEAAGAFKTIMTVIFVILMVAALWSFSTVLGGDSGTSKLIFYAFWALAFFTGLTTGPEGRPALGIVMVFLMMFILTSSYPGYVGSAVFGYWWPQISSFAETYMGPLNTALSQAQSGMGDVWLMMTNPQQYYLDMEIKNRATKSVITPGGRPESIELENFVLTPSIPGILEPSEPVVGMLYLNNKGDFTSEDIDLDVWTKWVNATDNTEKIVGNVVSLQCSKLVGPPGGVSGNPASCSWTGPTYPTEMRSITFMLGDGAAWGDIYSKCKDGTKDPSDPSSECPCFTGCPYGNTTYSYSGTTVKVGANLTYDYIVNVSLPINIINSDVYLNKLQAGEIVLQDLTSEYTGGPIKATLFSPKQPARTDIPFLVQASIYNDGQGELLSISNFEITIYGAGDSIESVELIGDDFRTSKPSVQPQPKGCGDYPLFIKSSGEEFIITCQHGYEGSVVKPGEFKRVSLYIKPKEGNIEDQRTTLIVGRATYRYRKTSSQTLTIANAPPQ